MNIILKEDQDTNGWISKIYFGFDKRVCRKKYIDLTKSYYRNMKLKEWKIQNVEHFCIWTQKCIKIILNLSS